MTATFLVTAAIIVALPGTGALYTISTGLTRGARTSLVAAVGCTLGIVPHLLAAITGTAALLRASGLAFEAVKLTGVLYLIWMAIATWRDRSPLVLEEQTTERSAGRIVGSGVLMNLLNPKLTIFFFAFLPQFVPAHSHHQLLTMVQLSGVFMAMTLLGFAVYGLFAAAVRRQVLERPEVIRRIRQAFALSFVGLGARLAVTHR